MSEATHPGHRAADPVTLARATGVLYLLIIALGLFSELGVRGSVLVAGDPAATAQRVAASETLFRVGFAADVVVFLADVAVAVLLYVLLRPTSRVGAAGAAGFRLTGTAIYGVNLLNQSAALLVLTGAGWLTAFDAAQRNALSLFFLELHGYGYDLGLVFFGVHCLVLGWLLHRSDLFPAVLGVLMGLAGAAYLIGSFTLFLAPAWTGAVAPVYAFSLIGEVAFTGWLLVKGVREPAGA